MSNMTALRDMHKKIQDLKKELSDLEATFDKVNSLVPPDVAVEVLCRLQLNIKNIPKDQRDAFLLHTGTGEEATVSMINELEMGEFLDLIQDTFHNTTDFYFEALTTEDVKNGK